MSESCIALYFPFGSLSTATSLAISQLSISHGSSLPTELTAVTFAALSITWAAVNASPSVLIIKPEPVVFITLTGGGGQLALLPEAIARSLDVECYLAENPHETVARGCGQTLEHWNEFGQFLGNRRR